MTLIFVYNSCLIPLSHILDSKWDTFTPAAEVYGFQKQIKKARAGWEKERNENYFKDYFMASSHFPDSSDTMLRS